METNSFSSSVILVKFSYVCAFLLIIWLEQFLKIKNNQSTADEGREVTLNIGIGLLFGLLSTFVNTFGLWLFKMGLFWLPSLSYSQKWMEYIVAFFALDFLYYWNHRLNHQVPWMWRAHSVHHSGRHFNLSLGPRQSVVQSVFALPFYLPLVFLGISLPVFLTVSVASILYQFVTHFHWTADVPILNRVFVLPRHHLVHHSSAQADYDKNFGGVFIFWDLIFGTFHDYREAISIGETKEAGSFEKSSFGRKLLLVFYPISGIFLPKESR